jgi:hypothetical protein
MEKVRESNVHARDLDISSRPNVSSLSIERPIAPERASRLEFHLELSGILAAPERQLTRNTRTEEIRLFSAAGALLQNGECLLLEYERDLRGSLHWRIGAELEIARRLSLVQHGLTATLASWGNRFRFAQASKDANNRSQRPQWFGWVEPVRHHLNRRELAGFAPASPSADATVVSLPPIIESRPFDSLGEAVLTNTGAAHLLIRMRRLVLSSEEQGEVERLIRRVENEAASAEMERLLIYLRAWIALSGGWHITCEARADQPLADGWLQLVGRQVFGGDVLTTLKETNSPADSVPKDEQIPMAFDLAACLPASCALIGSIPKPALFIERGARRVFNVALPRLPKSGPRLGEACAGSASESVRLHPAMRDRHVYCVGGTGSGKSTLLYSLIRQDLEAGEGVALIDPHGDLYQQVLSVVPVKRWRDVVLVDTASPKRLPGLNLLDIEPGPLAPLRRNFVVSELFGIFSELYDMKQCGGPMFEQYFRGALDLLLHSGGSWTLAEFPLVFQDTDFRNFLKQTCTDRGAVRFWNKMAERAGGESSLNNIAPYITSKLTGLLRSAVLRPIVGQVQTSIDFSRLLSRRGILLVNLSKGLLGELDTRLLGMLLIARLRSAALDRAQLPPERRKPFHLYVDEFQNFATESTGTMLAEARKFGLCLTLANQTLGQLADHSTRRGLLSAVLGNVGTMVLFRTGVYDSEHLAPYVAPALDAPSLQRLPNFHAVARLLTPEGPLEPVVLATEFPAQPDAKTAARARREIRRAQTQYARSVARVEKEIEQRITNFRQTIRTSTNGQS